MASGDQPVKKLILTAELFTLRNTIALAVLLLVAGAVCPAGRAVFAAEPASPRKGIEFFEKHVRPVLAKHCFRCHGTKKQESGFRLDSRKGLLTGGENYGPALKPGHPEQSALIKVIGYAGDIQMPPDSKLPAADVATLKHWITIGAPWPKDAHSAVSDRAPDLTAAWKSHWAAQPIRRPPWPALSSRKSSRSPIDRYIAARLRMHHLQPSPPADRRTLIRRATYDLTGLPPDPQDVQDFLQDTAADAFVRVVDRLLASPRYGERWGRYWLDVARYADTKGYVRLQEDPTYHYAYTYRDYVIRSFNEDLPYDRFVIEQLAADRLDLGDDNRPLAALGFLTLGRRFTGNKHDIIDDRIDVVTRGLLGLTVTCARCHDHKYDPVPMADYYSLYGVFASTREPAELPLIGIGKSRPVFHGNRTQYRTRRRVLDRLQQKEHALLLDNLRADTTRYLLRVLDGRQPFLVPMPARNGEIRRTFVEMWIDTIQSRSRHHDPVFAPWHSLAALSPGSFTSDAPRVLARLSEETSAGRRCNSRVLHALTRHPPASMTDVARLYGKLLTSVYHQWKSLIVRNPRAVALDNSADEELRQVLYGATSPFAITPRDAAINYLYDAKINAKLATAQRAFDNWLMGTGEAADRATALADAPIPYEPRVFIRGNPQRPGAAVPRRFLGLLSKSTRKPFVIGSGRLELARAIASKDNPLFARVLVNRVWLEHFGAGLVRTPSNFGLGGAKPSHPQLLDYLAWRFIRDGWSIKKLHRLMMLSGTYRQSSTDRPSCRQIDPDNRLLWKMNRRRLDFESLRDSLLWVAGRLESTLGGPPSPLTMPANHRRTVYGTVDRTHLPGMMRTFDFPSPDTHSPVRLATTVSQQALFLMNNPFVLERARDLAHRSRKDHPANPPAQTIRLYRLAFGRKPTPAETEQAVRFIRAGGSWQELVQVLLLSNEFLFTD